jgi:hypothetical protein
MKSNKKSIQEIIAKENPEFVEEVSKLSLEEIDARLAQLAKDSEAMQEQKDANEALSLAREVAKELNAPYVDAKKAIRLKSRYLISLLKDKGAIA